MSNILIIQSSPRSSGNSGKIIASLTNGAMGLSTNIIDLVHLNNLRFVNGCQACDKCKTTNSCVLVDDLTPILESISLAESVVISTPIYFDTASSIYKRLEDRMYCFLDKDGKSTIPAGKKLAIIVTCSSGNNVAEAEAERIRKVFVDTFKFNLVGKIVFAYTGDDGVEKNADILNQAVSIGKKL